MRLALRQVRFEHLAFRRADHDQIVVGTDTGGQLLPGVDFPYRLAVLELLDRAIVRRNIDVIADHGRPTEYEEARAGLASRHPVLTCPGNHDVRAPYRQVLLDEPEIPPIRTLFLAIRGQRARPAAVARVRDRLVAAASPR